MVRQCQYYFFGGILFSKPILFLPASSFKHLMPTSIKTHHNMLGIFATEICSRNYVFIGK